MDSKLRMDLMKDHKAKRAAHVDALMQVPMIRDSVAKHSKAQPKAKFVQKTIKARREKIEA